MSLFFFFTTSNGKKCLPWGWDFISGSSRVFVARMGRRRLFLQQEWTRLGYNYGFISFLSQENSLISYFSPSPEPHLHPSPQWSHRTDQAERSGEVFLCVQDFGSTLPSLLRSYTARDWAFLSVKTVQVFRKFTPLLLEKRPWRSLLEVTPIRRNWTSPCQAVLPRRWGDMMFSYSRTINTLVSQG